jgi:transposase
MDAPPFVSEADFAATPASVLALIRYLTARVAKLEAEVAALKSELAALKGGKTTPANSSLPPSATHPHDKPPPNKPKSSRKPGAQPGHEKHQRPLLPPEQCQQVIPVLPSACRRCGKTLTGVDPEPLRHQVWDLPEIQPLVVEYQRHRLVCSCGCSTCGELPAGVPTGQAGPRLIAFAALLMAHFRQSKRRAALFMSTILHQPASPGWLVSLQNLAALAVTPAYDELARALPNEAAPFIDESPTKQGAHKAWVWTFVASQFTFFACRVSRSGDVLDEFLTDLFDGIIHCDRARMYWKYGRRLQWCWAHLKRDFQGLIDDGCPTKKRLGRDLMRPTKQWFALWKRVRDGTLSVATFRRRMRPIRREIDRLLLRGSCNPLTHGFCKELVERKHNLWTFLDEDGVEPTNNAAERSLRHAVIWRKLSFGTQSTGGSEFVERLLTVIETCRRQSRNAFAWLTTALEAQLARRPAPSLLGA